MVPLHEIRKRNPRPHSPTSLAGHHVGPEISVTVGPRNLDIVTIRTFMKLDRAMVRYISIFSKERAGRTLGRITMTNPHCKQKCPST